MSEIQVSDGWRNSFHLTITLVIFNSNQIYRFRLSVFFFGFYFLLLFLILFHSIHYVHALLVLMDPLVVRLLVEK